MPMDRPGEPWSGATYHGFAAPGPEAPDPREPRRRLPAISRNQLIAGAAVAVALGLALGLWARPTLKTGAGPAQAELAAPARAVPIEVEHPAPQPQPHGGKLDVLPQAPARPAQVQAPPTFGPETPPAEDASQTAPAPIPAPRVDRTASPPSPAVPAPPAVLQRAPGPRASFDCSTARPGAEAMVCGDPGLAAADRELSRAYRRALASGAPPGAIRADQRDWLAIREDAARHSRRALAEVYQQRIDELNQIAEQPDGPPEDDDGPGG